MAELIFLIYKEFITKKKKRYNPEEQRAEDMNRSFTGKKMVINHTKRYSISLILK